MAKLIVYIAFFICCQAPNAPQAGQRRNGEAGVYIAFFIYCQAADQNQAAVPRGEGDRQAGVAAEVVTDYKTDELWEDGRLIATTKVEKPIMMICGTVEYGRPFVLEEKPFLFAWNSLDLIK
ncbi:hypothetical protein LOAG_15344 [Loa loa]|uniref:Uncharacterized protein n=1 Tax=Loa loa TaxID=7209 RepID=A0A1S0TFX7_LOALO|nr:hypothetical protein LOAG_15344 [Loa loa]EFO13187.1 hypothetical protein LOAG_15344 [Loa loa]